MSHHQWQPCRVTRRVVNYCGVRPDGSARLVHLHDGVGQRRIIDPDLPQNVIPLHPLTGKEVHRNEKGATDHDLTTVTLMGFAL